MHPFRQEDGKGFAAIAVRRGDRVIPIGAAVIGLIALHLGFATTFEAPPGLVTWSNFGLGAFAAVSRSFIPFGVVTGCMAISTMIKRRGRLDLDQRTPPRRERG